MPLANDVATGPPLAVPGVVAFGTAALIAVGLVGWALFSDRDGRLAGALGAAS